MYIKIHGWLKIETCREIMAAKLIQGREEQSRHCRDASTSVNYGKVRFKTVDDKEEGYEILSFVYDMAVVHINSQQCFFFPSNEKFQHRLWRGC